MGTGYDSNLIPDLFGRNGALLDLPHRKNFRLARPWNLLAGRTWFVAVKIRQELTEGSQVLAAVGAGIGVILHRGPATLAFHHESFFQEL